MNYEWHYRKRRKDKAAQVTSIPVTPEMNAKYQSLIARERTPVKSRDAENSRHD
jgi:hypothetical protein